jgi:uridine phosphorylase
LVSSASYPNFPGKHAEKAMFTPADFAAYLRRAGVLESYQPPAGVVLCYQRSLYDHVLQAEGLKSPERRGALQRLLLLPSTGGRVGLLGQLGIGAPAAAAALEELAAMGTSAFVSVGTAGSLQRNLTIGDLVLFEAAIRDEGVSHHYLPPAKLAMAAAPMNAALGAAMRQAGVRFRAGTSWTIDTPYRETVAEAPDTRPKECSAWKWRLLHCSRSPRSGACKSPRPSPSATLWPTWSGILDSTGHRSKPASSRCTR